MGIKRPNGTECALQAERHNGQESGLLTILPKFDSLTLYKLCM